ncbi:MAG: phosphate-binding protein, partial [Candidatus Promineifilaceae bacterium]
MRIKVLLSLVIVTLLLAACGGSSGQEVAPTVPAVAEEPAEAPTEVPAEEPAEVPTEAPAEEMMDAASMIGSPDPLAVSGNIVSAGSSTVFPLAE